MGFKLYKFEIDAPATVNKTKSYLMPLDKNIGTRFRIRRMWIAVPSLDAIAAADELAIQFHRSSARDELTTLLSIIDENEIFTKKFDFHLAEAALTILDDPSIEIEVPGIEGTLLNCSDKNYLTRLVTGQGAAKVTYVKILGQYENADAEDWNHNQF
jgi:glucuronate isomerase